MIVGTTQIAFLHVALDKSRVAHSLVAAIRLGSADELFDIGWEDYVNRGSVCAVEWSENVEDAFYGDEVVVRFEKLGPTTRRITITEGSGTSC